MPKKFNPSVNLGSYLHPTKVPLSGQSQGSRNRLERSSKDISTRMVDTIEDLKGLPGRYNADSRKGRRK